jgi:hypothetical protein
LPFFVDDFGTRQLTGTAYGQVARTIWIDNSTGEEFDDDPTAGELQAGSAQELAVTDADRDGEPDIMIGGMPAAVRYRRHSRPVSDDFHAVARCLWIVLLGFTGGCYARYCHLQRAQGESK